MGEMSSWDSQIGPWLLGALLLWVLYRRMRRQFGAQPVRPLRMGLRMALLLALGAALCPLALASPRLGLLMLAALAAGAGLGAWAAVHTRLERGEDARIYYVPHLYAGLVVTALVIGRVVYRLAIVPGGFAAMSPSQAPADVAASVAANPTTLVLLGVLLGYYLCYYACVLVKARRLEAASGPVRPSGEPGVP